MKIDYDEMWTNIWKAILVSIVISLSVLFGKFITADHQIRGYYINNYDNQLKIKADIDWQDDPSIKLDRCISVDSAITLVERLNKTVKK